MLSVLQYVIRCDISCITVDCCTHFLAPVIKQLFWKLTKLNITSFMSCSCWVILVCNIAQVPNSSPRWTEFITHWPLWSIYVAHFCMNWSNYIIMQWLPTYMARNLGANTNDIMFTAIPYLLNSVIGVSKSSSVFTFQHAFSLSQVQDSKQM